MQPILNRQQIHAYDRIAIEELGVPGTTLIENAGRGAADIVLRLMAESKAKIITVICGTGNNGGDGFVVGAQLAHELIHGLIVQVFVVGEANRIKGDAAVKLAELASAGVNPTLIDSNNLAVLMQALETSDLVVDGIFGTGLTRPVAGLEAETIKAMNACRAMRVALDLPSGLDADTGLELGIAVKASHTVSFACLKPGLVTPQGRSFAGKLHTVDLGVDHERILKATGVAAQLFAADDLRAIIAPRSATTYKHRAGDILVVAGSRTKIGAAKLVAEACLRAGAGLATILTWSDALPALAAWTREAMLLEIAAGDIAQTVSKALAKRSSVVIGPGLGLDHDAAELVKAVLSLATVPVVVDADALTLVAKNGSLPQSNASFILTPHAGELARLLKTEAATIEADRFASVARAAKEFRSVVVLKGAHTLVASPAGEIRVADFANPVLATAGSGDVLAGIIAAFAATLNPFDAACAGVVLHALAAEHWCSETGADRGMLAGDILDHLPAGWGKIISE
ncbi:MAG: NAD(P)H-hydrate dehydratase [Turneriella sp.]